MLEGALLSRRPCNWDGGLPAYLGNLRRMGIEKCIWTLYKQFFGLDATKHILTIPFPLLIFFSYPLGFIFGGCWLWTHEIGFAEISLFFFLHFDAFFNLFSDRNDEHMAIFKRI